MVAEGQGTQLQLGGGILLHCHCCWWCWQVLGMEQDGDAARSQRCRASCEVVPNTHGGPPCHRGDQGLDAGRCTPSLQHVLTLPEDPDALGGACASTGWPCGDLLPSSDTLCHRFPCTRSGRIFTGFDFKEQISSHPLGRTLVLGPAHFQAGFQRGRVGGHMAAAHMMGLELPAIFCCDQNDL